MTYKKVTKAEFAEFKGEIERLVNLWGVSDLEYVIELSEISKDDQAQMESYGDGYIKITMNTKINKEIPLNPLKLARHEFMHSLLFKYVTLAEKRFLSSDELLSEEEHLCRLAENGMESY